MRIDEYNYCPACRAYVSLDEIRVIDGDDTHDVLRGGCGYMVVNCTEEEYWGIEEKVDALRGGDGHEEGISQENASSDVSG